MLCLAFESHTSRERIVIISSANAAKVTGYKAVQPNCFIWQQDLRLNILQKAWAARSFCRPHYVTQCGCDTHGDTRFSPVPPTPSTQACCNSAFCKGSCVWKGLMYLFWWRVSADCFEPTHSEVWIRCVSLQNPHVACMSISHLNKKIKLVEHVPPPFYG